MKLKVKPLGEVVRVALQKLYSYNSANDQAKRETSVFIPGRFLPPTKAYRWETYDTEEFGKVQLFAIPRENGWVIKVRFSHPPVFNPVISGEEARKLREKLQK